MGLPSVIAGILVVHGGGLIPTARHYMWSVLALSVIALAGLLLTHRPPRTPLTTDGTATTTDVTASSRR